MFSRHERFESRAMERGMHLWRFGHYGVPLLVMPSAAGIAHEWQYNGLISDTQNRRSIEAWATQIVPRVASWEAPA